MGHVFSEQEALSTTAEAVFPTADILLRNATPDNPIRVVLKNDDAAIIIYVGASTVDVNTGFAIAAGASLNLDITHWKDALDLYVVAASGTPELHVLAIGALAA